MIQKTIRNIEQVYTLKEHIPLQTIHEFQSFDIN